MKKDGIPSNLVPCDRNLISKTWDLSSLRLHPPPLFSTLLLVPLLTSQSFSFLNYKGAGTILSGNGVKCGNFSNKEHIKKSSSWLLRPLNTQQKRAARTWLKAQGLFPPPFLCLFLPLPTLLRSMYYCRKQCSLSPTTLPPNWKLNLVLDGCINCITSWLARQRNKHHWFAVRVRQWMSGCECERRTVQECRM